MSQYLQIEPIYIYVIAIILGALFLINFGLKVIRRAESTRLNRAKETEAFEAVKTEAPVDEDIESITKSAALQSIESRFDVIRKVYIPMILILGLFLLVLPFIPTLPAAYISIVAGSFAVIIGIAAKPFIENVVSGLVLTISQPIRVNDTIRVDGKYGTVERINFLYTTVKIWNWNRWIIPNSKLINKEYENLSKTDEQEWAYIEFFVAPDSDIELVKKLAKESMENPYLDRIEAPSFWVMELEKDSIKCWVAGWAKNAAEAWALKAKTREILITKLQDRGIRYHKNLAEINASPSL